MYDPHGVTAGCLALIEAAAGSGVPILATEHYPRGIGHTVAPLADRIPPGAVMEKIQFSCFAELSVRRRIRAMGRQTMVLAGMEAHVCLGQSALDLNAAGYRVIVASDATASRTRLDHETALFRLAREGVEIASAEDVMAAWRDPVPGSIADRPDDRADSADRAGLS
jgi:isochorismate hydrolase